MTKLPVFVVCVVSAIPAGAQWLNYPTPGVPKTPSGPPNLNAATPRTADGKPDLSGVLDHAVSHRKGPGDVPSGVIRLARFCRYRS